MGGNPARDFTRLEFIGLIYPAFNLFVSRKWLDFSCDCQFYEATTSLMPGNYGDSLTYSLALSPKRVHLPIVVFDNTYFEVYHSTLN